ncbi:MAG TPA: histidine kinase [Actinomycetes bacterium]|jgi:signal transduction histidine kinase
MEAVDRGRGWNQVPAGDLLIAGGTAALTTAETLSGNHNDGPLAVYLLTGLLQTLPLAWRRRSPLGVLGFVLAVTMIEALLVVPSEGVGAFFGILIPVYTAAAHRPLRTATVALLLPLPVLAFTRWRVTGSPFEDLEFVTALMAGFWLAGRGVWSRQRLIEQLAVQSEQLRQGREAESRAAAAAERTRIARDMHDVIAHSISVMVVQAEAGEALVDDRSRAVEALHAIQRTGRSALADLRLLLDVLREEATAYDTEGGPLSPSPRLRDADALLAQVRAAGVDVDLTVEGEARELPASVDLAAYRVLQEALTNIIRHVGPTHAAATLRYGTDDLLVEVVDGGTGGRPAARALAHAGTGRGLLGMRERVGAFGGDFQAGPNGSGFRVRARIPIGTQQLGAQQ